MGFPPHKNKRQKYFKEVAAAGQTVVFYESGHRIKKCLAELQTYLDPKRKIIVCRELTKMFEEVVRGSILEIETYFSQHPEKMKGEFSVIVF